MAVLYKTFAVELDLSCILVDMSLDVGCASELFVAGSICDKARLFVCFVVALRELVKELILLLLLLDSGYLSLAVLFLCILVVRSFRDDYLALDCCGISLI